MNFSRLLQIIKEEISDFTSDWSMNDEPSIADRYYDKKGISGQPAQQTNQITAELVGYVDKQWKNPITPIPVYKNPRSLVGFTNETRGILMSNGDFYVAQSYNALHDNLLQMLADKGIVSLGSIYNYDKNYPEQFVAVQRTFNLSSFGQSMAYDEFPPHYQEIFRIGTQKQPFTFKAIPIPTGY